MALTSITATTGATVDGRLLAQTGAVTLDTNTITAATCATPLIHVAKTATLATLPAGGGSVTYDYTVTNVGTVIMDNITIADNKCTPTVWGQGDADSDTRLDFDETWLYSCTTTLIETTTNTVTATGDANGYTATDTADVTVTVAAAVGGDTEDEDITDEDVTDEDIASEDAAAATASNAATSSNATTATSQLPVAGADLGANDILWSLAVYYGKLIFKEIK